MGIVKKGLEYVGKKVTDYGKKKAKKKKDKEFDNMFEELMPSVIKKFNDSPRGKSFMKEQLNKKGFKKGDPLYEKVIKKGMKKGGMVKKCRMDGIALRGKTRAKERSK
tara:strand:- start:234 stop:557 length:324 start_codon:yes stop_codon:yes gene_type:complete